ncbi:uncharacterized protein LOC110412299 [Herrania umbratica]|uniref:Small ribosomal subunit protein bS18c n=1 Tax=Herrania umbratica TaxID=108875 RepID=A0A6J0ZVV0_9ROSI|nr:uncharacterized protein LOC110412299 [Herrania umbratica]
MRIARVLLGSLEGGLSRPGQHLQSVRFLSTGNGFDGQQPNSNSFESADEFERRIFGGYSGDSLKAQSFYENLDKLGRARNRYSPRLGGEDGPFSSLDDLDESFNTLSDGMDWKLKEAATYFEFDMDEIDKDDYAFRPDANFPPGSTYETKDLDLRRPGIRKPFRMPTFEVTTEEVLRKADFRNVRFLANFLTEGGIIIKRSSTRISAKAQRKVAREIKTARAFGLMPFTTMGTKSFVFGRTMENLDEDYQYETFDNSMTADADEKDPFEG